MLQNGIVDGIRGLVTTSGVTCAVVMETGSKARPHGNASSLHGHVDANRS